MSYSSLVDYVEISPNSTNPRSSKIDTITIHHMAGDLTVEQCGAVFAPKARQASANYAIDNDCRVGLYVDEDNRSWASSSKSNDNRAVTIELANDDTSTWHVSDAVIEKCIELCVDICKRNDIKQLNFTGDRTGNLTMHRYFANTLCPGDYLASKFPYIAQKVNDKLQDKEELTMSQYNELKQYIESLEEKVSYLTNELASTRTRINKLDAGLDAVKVYAGIQYDYVDENMPAFARDTIKKLQRLGVVEGKLQMSYDDIRVFTILDRLSVIDNCVEYKTLTDVPEYGRATIEKLLNADVLRGDGSSLAITEQTVKLLVYFDRMNLLNV